MSYFNSNMKLCLFGLVLSSHASLAGLILPDFVTNDCGPKKTPEPLVNIQHHKNWCRDWCVVAPKSEATPSVIWVDPENDPANYNYAKAPWLAPAALNIFLRHIESKGVGYRQGYTTLGLFYTPETWFADPRYQTFFDWRNHIFDNGKYAMNIGAGFRFRDPRLENVYGINIYYDFRNDCADYHQIGIGAEMAACYYTLRINGYFPVGTRSHSSFRAREIKTHDCDCDCDVCEHACDDKVLDHHRDNFLDHHPERDHDMDQHPDCNHTEDLCHNHDCDHDHHHDHDKDHHHDRDHDRDRDCEDHDHDRDICCDDDHHKDHDHHWNRRSNNEKSHHFDPEPDNNQCNNFQEFQLCTRNQRSLGGFDAEIETSLKRFSILWNTNWDVYGAIGPYYYKRDCCNNNVIGGKLRVGASYLDYLTFEIRFSYDQTFHGIVQGLIGINFPLGGLELDCEMDYCTAFLRKIGLQFVQRNEIIVLKDRLCCPAQINNNNSDDD